MELPQHYYLGNDSANPFYNIDLPIGYIDGQPIYEYQYSMLCCLLEDKERLTDDSFDIPF